MQQAIILSRDGLVVASSRGLTREDGEHLSALAAGVQSLARGAGEHFDGGRGPADDHRDGTAFLFIVSAGKGTCLAVLTSAEPNIVHHRLRDGHAGAAHGQVPRGRAAIPPGNRRRVTGQHGQGIAGSTGTRAGGPALRRDQGADPAERRGVVRPDRRGVGDRRAGAGALPARPEHRRILSLCRRPTPIVDLTSDIDLPLGVVRVLLGDLTSEGLVRVPATQEQAATISAY